MIPDWAFYVLLLFSVFISAVSQIILKKSANQTHDRIIKEYLNIKVIGAYFIFFISTVLTMFSFKKVPLSMGPVLEATGYIWVALLGLFWLKEPISKKKWAGIGIILLGILIFNL